MDKMLYKYKDLTNIRKKITEIVNDDEVGIYIKKDCIQVQLPIKIKTDQVTEIDKIFGVNGIIDANQYAQVIILEYRDD